MGSVTLAWPIAVALVLALAAGCGTPSSVLTTDDMAALSSLYNAVPGRLRPARVELDVKPDGAVELHTQTEFTVEKPTPEDPFWVPLGLFPELPEYYAATHGTRGEPLGLQAYRVSGGLWCIVAMVSPSVLQAAAREAQGSSSVETFSLDFNLLVVSPSLSSRLPLVIPAGPDPGGFVASIALPPRARFSSLSVAAGLRTAAPRTATLTLLPKSLSPGRPRAAAQLVAEAATAWDFSAVRFAQPMTSAGAAFFAVMLGILTAICAYLVARWGALDHLVRRLLGRPVVSELAEPPALTPESVEMHRIKLRSYLLRELAELLGRAPSDEVEHRIDKLKRVDKSLEELAAFVRPTQFRIGTGRVAFLIAVVVGVVTTLLLWLAVAGGQPRRGSAPSAATVAVGDLRLAAAFQDANPDIVAMSLSFFAVTSTRDSHGPREVSIGTGGAATAHMSDMSVKPEGVKFTLSRNNAKLTVPTTVNRDIGLLAALATAPIAEIRAEKSYVGALTDGKLIQVSYLLGGVNRMNDRTANGWLHWFPLDEKISEIPISLSQPAILSRVEIQRPPDFAGHVSADTIARAFVQQDRKYLLDAGPDHRVILPAGRTTTFKIGFQRTALQRLVLLLGPPIVALVAGVVLGLLAKQTTTAWASLVQALGILGLPFGIRSAVFSVYKDLPTIMVGQSPTLFELVFIGSWIVFAIISVVVWKR